MILLRRRLFSSSTSLFRRFVRLYHLLDRRPRHVRDRCQPFVRLQGHGEGGPERRLVEAGDGRAGRVGLELGDGRGAEDRSFSSGRARAVFCAAADADDLSFLSLDFFFFLGPGAPVQALERVRQRVAEAEPERGGVVGLEGRREEQGELVLLGFF